MFDRKSNVLACIPQYFQFFSFMMVLLFLLYCAMLALGHKAFPCIFPIVFMVRKKLLTHLRLCCIKCCPLQQTKIMLYHIFWIVFIVVIWSYRVWSWNWDHSSWREPVILLSRYATLSWQDDRDCGWQFNWQMDLRMWFKTMEGSENSKEVCTECCALLCLKSRAAVESERNIEDELTISLFLFCDSDFFTFFFQGDNADFLITIGSQW